MSTNANIGFGEESQGLIIPLDSNALGDFILGLLGQRRSIEQHFLDRSFLIDLKWLWNFDEIIEQRISAQNTGKLVSFSSKFFFEDGRITQLTSRAAFKGFHDFSTRRAIGVDVTWTYLIHFPNSKVPEKQEIRFRAFTDKRVTVEKPIKNSGRYFAFLDARYHELSFLVSFTDLTWGEDMSNHMASFISSKTSRLSWVTRKARAFDAKYMMPLFLTLSMFASLYSLDRKSFLNEVSARYHVVPSQGAVLGSLQEKVDFLVDVAVAQLAQNQGVILPLIKMNAIAVGAFLLWVVLGIRKASFISINEYSDSYSNGLIRRFELIKYGVLLSCVVGIVGSLFASTIYDYLKSSILF